MNMAINLTVAELDTLADKRVQAQTGEIGYWEIYQWLGDLIQAKGAPPTNSAVLWLRGATEANAGRGAFSALIRGYTESQHQLRYGTSIPTSPDKLQEASNTGKIGVRLKFPQSEFSTFPYGSPSPPDPPRLPPPRYPARQQPAGYLFNAR
jgi:hypothetical protein